MAKQAAISAINVLLAYAALPDRDQQFFNNMLNEYIFASWVHKREFIENWRRELVSSGETVIVPTHD
jgi:hypothetical protein